MQPEKPAFNPEAEGVQRTKTGAAHIRESGTPKLPTDTPETVLHEEAHRAAETEINETLAETTRQEILKHYGIDPERAVSIPANKGSKREMRAFSILENTENPDIKYYADGHTAHAVLLDTILTHFPEIGSKNRTQLPDDFLKKWSIRKGFIDPQRNHFKSFQETHSALQNLLIQNKETNGLDKETVEELEHNPNAELPNWFRTG